MTDSGAIECRPHEHVNGILKVDTNADTVTKLNGNLLPERGGRVMWSSYALALDGCIYSMPHGARRIMKLDPNDNDAISSVGNDLRSRSYIATVVGIDGCVYEIPSICTSNPIVKYDSVNDTTSFFGGGTNNVGWEMKKCFECNGGGALGSDEQIYAVTYDGRDKYNQ